MAKLHLFPNLKYDFQVHQFSCAPKYHVIICAEFYQNLSYNRECAGRN